MKTLFSTLKFSFKVFAKNKFHLFLILVCLIVSFSFFYIILQKAYADSLYNKHFNSGQSVFRITTYYDAYDVASASNKMQVFKAIQDQVPEIGQGAGVKIIQPKLVNSDTSEEDICENFFLMDNSALDLFDVRTINSTHQGLAKGELLISREQCVKLFSGTDVVGQLLTIGFNNKEYEFVIGGVFQDFKRLSTFSPHFIVPFESFYGAKQKERQNTEFFVSVTRDEVKTIESKINALAIADQGMKFSLQSVDDIYFHSSSLINDLHKKGNFQFYKVSLLVAAVLLVFGFLNFLSLVVSFYVQRIKELYVRKVNGSGEKEFTLLFFIELTGLFFIVILLGVVGVSLFRSHHSFQVFTQTFLSPAQKLILFCFVSGVAVLLIIITTILLKKIILNRYFRGYWNYVSYRGSTWFNKIFQVLQLSIVLLLFIFISTVTKQIGHSFSGIKGYEHTHLLQASFPVFSGEDKYNVLRQKLLNYPGILNVSGSYGAPMNDASFFMNLTSKIDNKKVAFEAKAVCPGYFDALNASFVKKIDAETLGNFSQNDVLVNETGYKILGLHHTAGEIVDKYHVKGVVQDINDKTSSEKVPPKLYMIAKEPISALLIRHDGKNSLQACKEIVRNEYVQVFPDFTSNIKSYDTIFAQAYAKEVELRDFLSLFLAVMVLLTVFGFFSIVNYNFMRKAKGLAINKVLGAGLYRLLGKQVNLWVFIFLISSVMSCIAGYYLSERWLSAYFYKINTSSYIYVSTVIIAFMIILMNVLFFVGKVKRMNVCKVMKEEG